jgi:AcrR family transcriptional regulator
MNQASHRERHTPPSLRQRVKVLVRDELLQAAEELFAEQGLQAATLEDIASRAGVAVGTIYNYFADRHALLQAVMESRRQELGEDLRAIEKQTLGLPFHERLDRFLRALLEHFDHQRRFYSILVQAECTPLKTHLMNPGEGPFADVYRHAEKLLAEGVASGALRRESSSFLSLMLVGMARGTAFRALLDPKAPSISSKRGQILRFFLEGAQAHPSPRLVTPSPTERSVLHGVKHG